MQNENSRNTLIFFVCAALIMGIYYFTVMRPQAEAQRQARIAAAELSQDADDASNTALRPEVEVFAQDRSTALGDAAGRVAIETGTLKGSLSLLGARIDDLFLTDYREELGSEDPVELFRPQGMEHAYFAQFGWRGANIPGGVPGPNTVWTLAKGQTLTPTTPVELTWDNGAGLRFTREISIDDQYLFTVKDTVANLGTTAVTIAPYGRVERQGVPADLGKQMILHEGAIGTFGSGNSYSTEQIKYKDWAKKARVEKESTGGWMGITDKYWLAALIPSQDEKVEGRFTVRNVQNVDVHEAAMLGQTFTINPGKQIVETQRLFAGVKRNEVLKSYEERLGLPRFVYAIDWGMFWFLTRPLFVIVDFFYGVMGNFGLAILGLTVVVKLILFPLANKSYASLSKMRTLQPKMEEIKKKHGKDPQKQQQEMMALYQREKINPLAGCLPILVQIPVFYALYKVLFVTIEMRHAPFFGWIKDLSARDPSTIWNLFGAIPYDPATIPLLGGLLNGPLHLGVLPIVYGLTMWLQMSMNPPAQDPIQRQIFAIMPLVFTFIMAPFAAGLLIYWAWNNILSIVQQYVIMHKFKAENPIDTFLARFKKA
ncbi:MULTISPECIES: membrane protein insertase YidC [unclassified Brevundimonas]|uniref:membrane protein insertase YidC n=1 Tax=unclassified Brevundimonas TaxID=2622653 RepID=UPI0025C436E6|nr:MULTISPECIES: membrane protein insertase YidC [unclassified Brevundimonas]